MIGSFEFNNIESESFGLICRSISRPLLPVMNPRTLQIFGKSGVIDFGDNDYATRQITMHLAYKGESYVELRSRAREIGAWLNTAVWQRLIINDEPDKYYLARVYSGIDLDTLKMFGEADITFECQPFAYMTVSTGEDPTWEEADFPWLVDMPWNMIQSYQFSATANASLTFENPGTKETNYRSPQGSKFDIIITGSWTTLSLSMNGKTLNYTEAGSGTLTIDNINMEVDLGGVNKLSKVTGDLATFLTVLPGNNTISITGTGLNVTVTIDFIPMWL